MALAADSQQSGRNADFAITPLSPIKEVLFNILMCSAQGTVQGSLAQALIPKQLIGKSFGASNNDVAWFPAAYGLITGVLNSLFSLELLVLVDLT